LRFPTKTPKIRQQIVVKIPFWLVPQSFRDATRFYRTYGMRELMHQRGVSFGQFGEDIILQKCFFPDKDKGFYVDVGAYDPVCFSNTHLFYRKGWSGINIEPNPAGFKRFNRYRPRDINLNLAISDEEIELQFTVDSVFSSIFDPSTGRHPRNPEAKQITVNAKPLRAILDQFLPPQVSIDFMNIDCEGHDRVVLESNDWNRYRPTVILIEDTARENDAEINRYMLQMGYALFFHLQLTKIFVSKSSHIPG
jgi:FkbM family methyltransferase